MSGKQDYVAVMKQDDSSAPHAKPFQSISKEQEAQAERHGAFGEAEGSAPPTYASTPHADAPPPTYKSLTEVVEEDVHALLIGDPNDSISVPMVHTTEKQSFKTVFLGKNAKTSHTVIARKMPRSHYLKFYAKDSNGKYIGTEKAAVDAGLVFVPSKSTPEDLLQQVRKVAFNKPHYSNDFGHVFGMPGVGGGVAY